MSIAQDTPAPTEAPAATIDLTEPDATRTVVPGLPTDGPSAPARPVFTITEAATACAVSRKTITRKLADLAEHGAAKDEDGVWRIPVEALLAVGLHPGRSLPERRGDAPEPARAPSGNGIAPRPAPSSGPDMITVSRDRWDDLRIRLARAEAQAAERDLALADARLALRALTAGPATVPAVGGPAAVPVAQGQSESGPSTHVGAVRPGPATPRAEPMLGAAVPMAPGAPTDHQVSGAPLAGPPGSADEIGAGAAGAPTAPAPDLAIARSEAARTGGYVPAANQPVKRRRWWQSK